MAEGTLRTVVTGLRWAGLMQWIRDATFSMGLEDYSVEYPGFIRTTIHVKVCGDTVKLANFRDKLYAAVDKYNNS